MASASSTPSPTPTPTQTPTPTPTPITTQPHNLVGEEENYDESEDEDFNPDIGADALESEDSDDDGGNDGHEEGSRGDDGVTGKKKGDGKGPKRSQKRKATTAQDEGDGGLDFANSGDEATIRKGKRRKRKGGTGDGGGEEDEGGEAGLVKTRAQRAREEKERKPLASADSATVDVDALWRSMTSARRKDEDKTTATQTAHESDTSKPAEAKPNGTSIGNGTQHARIDPTPAQMSNTPHTEEMITIKRTYAFAGETITEEKLVPKSSAEARLYLQPLQEQNGSSAPKTKPPLRRPKKRTSIFEPNPDGIVKGLAPVGANKGPKLNTVEKSKLDWAGFVDKEGIAEELDDASKGKEGYLGRMDFLGRVEAKRDEEMKSARKK